jgi:hypothetical protein
MGPNRGDSPTLGCPQCGGSYGTFAYEIFEPPADLDEGLLQLYRPHSHLYGEFL